LLLLIIATRSVSQEWIPLGPGQDSVTPHISFLSNSRGVRTLKVISVLVDFNIVLEEVEQ